VASWAFVPLTIECDEQRALQQSHAIARFFVPNDENEKPMDEELSWAELRYWVEFGCWTTLALAPFLYWVNGPAVSDDQFVVRTALVGLAALGAVGLRTYQLLHRSRH